MSWFGETFGDSFNSLKGQITKITKEVLADDEATNDDIQEPKNQLVKELKDLCESKDLEIASLRNEFKKLHDQHKSHIEFLRAECTTGGSEGFSDNDISKIKKLENELIEVKQERDYLNSCLDELQSEHQINLDQVISLKDKYKAELEMLKNKNDSCENKFDYSLGNSTEKEIDKEKLNEIDLLKSKIKELQSLLEEQKKDSAVMTKNEIKTQDDIKKKYDESNDIQEISEDKAIIEIEKKSIQKENEELKDRLLEKEKENKEYELNFTLLLNEKEELLQKCQNYEIIESKLSDLIKVECEVKQKLQNVSQTLNVEVNTTLNNNNIVELISLIESKVNQMRIELSDIQKESVNLKLEINNLKEDNKSFQNKLKISVENATETERKYQEEISLLKNSLSGMKTQEQNCISQSQTDDVKKLEQELAQCMNFLLVKNNEVTDYSKLLNNVQEELKNLRTSSSSIQDELLTTKEERKKLEEEIINLKNLNIKLEKEKAETEDVLKNLKSEKINLDLKNNQFSCKLEVLEKELADFKTDKEKTKLLQDELKETTFIKSELEKNLIELKNENSTLRNEIKHMQAEIIIKESNLAELMKSNTFFQEEINKLQAQGNDIENLEKEVKKWKDASVDLQIHVEDIINKNEELNNEFSKSKHGLEIMLAEKESKIQQLKLTNLNLLESYNEMQYQNKSEVQGEQHSTVEKQELNEEYQKQSDLISQLQKENNDLKCEISKFQEQMKMQMFQPKSQTFLKENVQQHKRSKSDVDSEILSSHLSGTFSNEKLMLHKQVLEQEQAKYHLLENQFQEIANKEANARRDFERLKKHLIEVEDHYTEEAIENKKIITELRSKLVAAEEQLQNSSTLYTSLKVRENQHIQSLQSQIKMVSVQRDDFQAKLSAAEDEIQKHKASLMSLQIVLEQFQQDKEREVEEVAIKYEKQLKCIGNHTRDLEAEIQSLQNQLFEAKNGLKAASRLGEQLEKKTQQVSDLEEQLRIVNSKVVEVENSLSNANQVNKGKIDKSLIKNLLIGYVLSANADRKSQVLRIMASVLDFDQDERNKMGVDANRSGWLSSILHPKGETASSSESLSEAFIKFLENESRPQPQLKLLPEQLEVSTPNTSKMVPKKNDRLSELTLPTFNSSHENESSIILKSVLKDS